MIIFDGSNDDLVHVSGQANYPVCDEVNVNERNSYATSFYVKAGEWGGRMLVHAIYDGCWAFAPGLWDEGDEFPNWPISFKVNDNGYSLDLWLDAPADTWVKEEGTLNDED